MELYKQSIDDIQNQFGVQHTSGLNENDIALRREKFGRNELKAAKKISPLKLFLSQFNDVLIFVLIIAATVSLGISYLEKHHNYAESILIYCIVVAIALVGFFNEYKAEKTVEALKKLVGQKAKVRRGGSIVEIDAVDIVPGDVVLLEEGAKIPADLRLYLVKNMSVNESSLTGESVPVSKNTLDIDETVALGDQKNMAFSGTLVTTGVAEGIAVATAHDTQIGKIATMVNEVEEEQTPMQKKLDALGRKLGAIILAICVIVFVVIYFLDKDLHGTGVFQRVLFAFTGAVALAVAAIPEGLAFVVRISLALGARRMAGKNALVRKLSAVEALGSTDVICSDKTGTLTRGEMTVRQIWANKRIYEVTGTGYETEGGFLLNDKPLPDLKNLEALLLTGMLCNNARLKEQAVLGDPTEGCLIVSAVKAGLNFEETTSTHQKIDEVPFSSERKRMSTVHRNEKGFMVASKGAADVLLNQCSRILIDGKVEKLTKELQQEILNTNNTMASSALRVLGMAYKEEKTQPKEDEEIESDLIFLGLQGMMDPPRVEVKEVMHRVTNEAGMKVVMITGDHIETARAVAKEIGIVGDALSGVDLDKLSEEEFAKKVLSTNVYARVNPEHKIKIVKALQKHGLQVAMTGDGVNDAPAIKASDIGVAMGITGTDVTKEAADLILLDDQFLTIVSAIEEGRGIFDNVRKFVNYLLSANIAEVITVLGGILVLGKLVLGAAQLLFINIVTDGLPAIALGSDPAEKDIMRFKPNHFQGSIINSRIWLEMFIFGTAMSVLLLFHYWFILSQGHDGPRATAVIFVAMVVYELIRLVGIRSEYKISWLANPWLLVAIFSSLVLQISVLHIPPLAKIFEVGPIHIIDWVFIAVGALGLLIFMKVLDIILDRKMAEVQPPRVAT